MTTESQKAVLLLEDGTFFTGKSLGKKGTAAGEICFNSGMTGAKEIYTDPSYSGKILVHTVAHVGIGGMAESFRSESSEVRINGVVINHFEKDYYPRATAQQTLNDYFNENGVVGIYEMDTRQLVRYIREHGEMKCLISTDGRDVEVLKAELASWSSSNVHEQTLKASTSQSYFLGNPESKKKLAVLDLGLKASILENLVERDCYVGVFNAFGSTEEMIDWNADGYLISSGPGSPFELDEIKGKVRALLDTGKPLFGIGLGHNLLGATQGIKSDKLFHGHRGANYPVKNLKRGTSQVAAKNSGFTLNLVQTNAHPNIEVTHINLNDRSIEGIRLKDRPAFSVQFQPEAHPGPHDNRYLFDEFVEMIN